MKFIDLTQPLGPFTPRSSDHPEVQFPVLRHYSTHGLITREIHASLHSGTHVDAPSLYMPAGKNIEDLPLEWFCGTGYVVDLTDLGNWGIISAEVLDARAAEIKPGDIIGLWTGWAHYYAADEQRYILQPPGLDRSGVDWMVEHEIKAIYSDTPSSEHVFMRSRQWRTLRPDIFGSAEIDADRFPPSYGHKRLLPANIMMVENLSEALGTLAGTRSTFIAFPAKYAGVEGAPARVAAVTEFP
jgi:arylformamidase